MDRVFEAAKLKSLEVKNRLVMAPMCMYMSDETGRVMPFHRIHYATRSVGGIGLILLEATAIEPRGRITDRDLGIWDDRHIPGLQSIVEEVHQQGAKIGIQLAHAGRKCTVDKETIIAPSPMPFSERYSSPKTMTIEDIEEVIDGFKEGARRAHLAGFDLIEIHGAHGYLINQFISPLTNKREDAYGGDLRGRLRFLKEIIDGIKTVWSEEKPILIRLSAEEYHPEGHHVEETIQVIDLVKDQIDGFNISSGGVVPYGIDSYPGYQIPLSDEIKKKTGVKTIGGGLLNNYDIVNEVIQNGRADFVYLGRLLLRDPYFPLKCAKALEKEALIPKAYKRGF